MMVYFSIAHLVMFDDIKLMKHLYKVAKTKILSHKN